MQIETPLKILPLFAVAFDNAHVLVYRIIVSLYLRYLGDWSDSVEEVCSWKLMYRRHF